MTIAARARSRSLLVTEAATSNSAVLVQCRLMLLGGCIQRASFFFSSRRRHTRYMGDWSSDVCSSDLQAVEQCRVEGPARRHRCTARPPDREAERVVPGAGASARCQPDQPEAGSRHPYSRTQSRQALKGAFLMALLGKILVFVHTGLSLCLAAWALALYTNRVDWTDRKAAADKPAGVLAQRRAEYERVVSSAVRPADTRFRNNRQLLVFHEAWRPAEKVWFAQELEH